MNITINTITYFIINIYGAFELFRNKRYMLDEMFLKNASKFTKYIFWNTKTGDVVIFFHFILLAFPTINALVYVDINQGIHLCSKE